MKRTHLLFTVVLLIAAMSMFFAGCSAAPDAVGVDGMPMRANVNLNTYYANAFGKTGEALRTALKSIITGGQHVPSYTGLWSAYATSDRTPDGKIWDMYSDNGTGSHPYYSFTYSTSQCGTYSGEGGCYNREHSWPKSWFSSATPMYSDLVHVVPTDGYVNAKRGNWAFGETASASWTSRNGSKLGAPSSELKGWGCTESTVFEPINAFKGDFARIYFYMVTRYHGTSDSGPMSSNFTLKPWAKQLLLKWHRMDPVSAKELARNDAIYSIQGNRNPFVDYPDWVEVIWGDGGSSSSSSSSSSTSGGGSEDFSNCTSTSGSYISGSFTGKNSVKWTYGYTRWDKTIDSKAPTMGKSTSGTVYSAAVAGGCGTLSFKYKQAFSTRVNFSVYVNSTKVKTITSGTSGTVSVPVNISGSVVIKFKQNASTSGQVSIDTVQWTGK